MGTLTLTIIRTLIRSNLNESAETRITNTELNSIINDGYKDVSAKGLCYENKIAKDNIAASEKIISLVGSNVIRVNYVEYKTGATEGGKGLLCVLPQSIGYNPLSGDYPQGWFQWGQYLYIEPIPDVATYDLAVYAACYPAAVMSVDGDLPASLPVEFHECVYEYTLAFACLKLKRWGDAAAFYNNYIMNVQRKRMEFISKTPDARAMRIIPDTVEVRNG
jgi:hypothetical protein